MKDLIDRQAAIDALADMHCKSDEDGYVWIIRSDAWARIDALPSVHPTYTDAEIQKMQDMEQAQLEKAFDLGREDALSEIIRCKDCKHKGTKNCVANAWTTIFGVTVKDDFYCGLAERRTDD